MAGSFLSIGGIRGTCTRDTIQREVTRHLPSLRKPSGACTIPKKGGVPTCRITYDELTQRRPLTRSEVATVRQIAKRNGATVKIRPAE